jgi:hypothetical chaperone protein
MNFRIEELLSLLAREMVRLTEATLGHTLTDVTVGRPVHFSEDPESETLARERLEEAWRLATGARVSFVEEPVGAMQHFADGYSSATPMHVLVFDFGGGTLDLCVAVVESGTVRPLATHGVPIGGDLLDSRIVEVQLAPLFGEQARYRRSGLPLPAHLFRRIRTWQTLSELNKPEYVHLIERAKRESDQPQRLERLETLVRQNYGRAFFQAVERAKVELSSNMQAEVSMDVPGLSLNEVLSRAEFEGTVSPQLAAARACVLEAIGRAGLDPGQIGLVLTTGGSSQIPAFQRMLREVLPSAELRATDAYTSVAAGLAIHGFKNAAA